jgi:hypothetical protein
MIFPKRAACLPQADGSARHERGNEKINSIADMYNDTLLA